MTTTLIAETTSHTSHLGISFSIDTRLSDYDQIVIDVPHLEYQMLSTGWSRVNTGNVKFRVERIRYSLTNETFALCSIEGRGFTKSGSLRVRETNFWTKDLIAYPEILAQIPDHYHDKAKELFLQGSKELVENANAISANGLSTIPLEDK
jgi:hypothetical protein